MGILNKIFGRKTPKKEKNDTMPFFWEDDFCQIEIVPRENDDHITKSIKDIEEFTTKTKTENGFTDIYMREELPFQTSNEEIRKDYFEQLLSRNGFEKARQISYDGRKIIDCSPETTNAYSVGTFNIFYDGKDEFVSNVWITSLQISKDELGKILETLYEVGEETQSILIDWNSLELIDLSNRNQIKKYLMKYEGR